MTISIKSKKNDTVVFYRVLLKSPFGLISPLNLFRECAFIIRKSGYKVNRFSVACKIDFIIQN